MEREKKNSRWSDSTEGCVEETEGSVAGHIMLLSWPKGLWPMVFYGAYIIYDIVLYIKHSVIHNIYIYICKYKHIYVCMYACLYLQLS